MLFVRLFGLIVVVGLAGCQRSGAVRDAAPAPLVEVVRDAAGDGKEVGKTVNGLALALSSAPERLAPGKQLLCTLTLHNRTDKTFQVALHDQGCCLWSNLRFNPDLQTGGSGHTVSPNFFPGGVHLIFGGGNIALKFRLERAADGQSLFVPTQAHQGQGCGSTCIIPSDLKKVEMQVRLHEHDTIGWSNLKYTEQRWSGECVSNAVTLQLE